MLTLAQAQALSNPKLTKFVIDEFRTSALADKLVWDNNAKAQGGASFSYVYNRMLALPTALARRVNTDYTAQEATTQQITATLGILGGSFQIDRALAANEKEVVDLVEFQVQQKAKATLAQFHNYFINGSAAAVDGNNVLIGEFDGLNRFLAGAGAGQVLNAAVDLSSSANITLNWATLLDNFRMARAAMDNAPTVWLMNQRMYGVWQSCMDRAGINVLSKNEYGYEVSQWGPSLVMAMGDVPGGTTPIIADGATTSIYGVYIGLDGVHGISPDNGAFIKTYLPNFNQAAAVQTGAVEMIAGVAIKSVRSVVRIDGIDITA